MSQTVKKPNTSLNLGDIGNVLSNLDGITAVTGMLSACFAGMTAIGVYAATTLPWATMNTKDKLLEGGLSALGTAAGAWATAYIGKFPLEHIKEDLKEEKQFKANSYHLS